MTKIETLTPEQSEAVMQRYDEWLAVGRQFGETDREAAKAAVSALYVNAGRPEPKYVLQFTSPAIAGLAVAILRIPEWGKQLWGQLRGQLRGQLEDQLEVQLRDQLEDQLEVQLRGQLRGQLWDQLRGQLEDQLRGQLWVQLWGQLGGKWVFPAFWGMHEAGWISFYSFCEEIGVKYTSEQSGWLAAHRDVVKHCGWWWAFNEIVVISDRPTFQSVDGQGRLHNETRAAMQFADGYSLWSWNGTRVSEEVITTDPTTWDAKRILNEPNSEVRRVMVERLGWDQFVATANLQLVDRQPDPANDGYDIELYDVPQRIYDEAVRVILVTNASPERDGTRRRFGLTVPASIDDAVEAAAWTFDTTVDTYRQLCRAT
jgi:hypothetical protein